MNDIIEIAGKTFIITRVNDGFGNSLFACGILPMRANRDDLIRDIQRSQGPEWRDRGPIRNNQNRSDQKF